MFKKLTLFILSLIVILCCSVAVLGVSAADDTMEKLNSLVQQFPNGKYWNHMGSDENNPDGWTDKPCDNHRNCDWREDACSCNSYDNAIQCMGYAYKIAYEITGVSGRDFSKTTTLKASNLRVGDIIRYNGHSICVTGVSGTKISFTDNNYSGLCKIRWGQMDISSIKSFNYVLHLEGNNRKNTDLDFYENVTSDSDSEATSSLKETWQMSDSTLNVRSSASTSGGIVGTIPADAKFYVYEKKTTEDYLWGKVKYGSVSGWAALNYSYYVSGYYEKADLIDTESSYDSLDITFKWKEVSGAEKYQLRIYDASKKLILRYYTAETQYNVTLPENGTYYAKVYSHNSHCTTWLVDGTLIKFTAENESGPVAVTQIKLNKTSQSVIKGAKVTLTAQVLPENAENKTVTWKSDKKSVATVNSKGVVTAVSYGNTNIICTSHDGNITAKFKITVVPAKVSGFKQIHGKTTETAIPLSWTKLSGVDGYEVMRYNSSKKTIDSLGYTTSNSFTDKTAKVSCDYYYYVRAYVTVNSKKIVGPSVKIKCSSDPGVVKTISQSASSSGSVTIKWSAVKNADLYTVYRYNSKNKSYTKIGNTSKTYLKITQTAGTSYYYRVYAATKTSWGYAYGTRSAAFLATSGPAKVTVKLSNAGTGKIKISWNKVSGATHYQIFRYGAKGYEKIGTVSSRYGSFTNIKLTKGKYYYYRVRPIIIKNGKVSYGAYSTTVKLKAK